jgi:hypothetical protein
MPQSRVEKNVILEESCFKPALCLIVTRCFQHDIQISCPLYVQN